MVTTRIIVGPTEGALLESLIGQHKKIIFLTEGNLKFKGVVKTLIP